MTEKQKKRKIRSHFKMYLHENFKSTRDPLYILLPFTEQMRLCEIVMRQFNPKTDKPIDAIIMMKEALEAFYDKAEL